MSIPLPQLPLEMVEAILDHLHNDTKSLKACTLVCRNWKHPARRLLFYRCAIHLPQYRADTFWQLRISAALPFLRHLCIDTSQGPQDWDAILPFLVGSNIRTLHLLSRRLYTLSRHALSALVRTFSGVVNLCLEKVKLNSVLSFARLVSVLPCLQTLSVKRAMITDTSKPEPNRPPWNKYKPSPQLAALELDMPGMDSILEWFLALANPPVFRSICLHYNKKNDPDVIHKFVASLGDSLEHLSFPICNSPHSFDLSHLTQLRSIQITLYYHSRSASLTHLLSYISSTHLERIAFHVSFPSERNLTGTLLQWNQVDHVLQRSPFEGLKVVYIVCTGDPPPWEFDPILRDMSRCATRRILSICKRGVLGGREAKFYGAGAGTPTEVFGCGPPWRH